MLVKAMSVGYFGNKRIKEGQVFKIVDLKVTSIGKDGKEVVKTISAKSQFSPLWMEQVDEKEAKAAAKQTVKFDREDNVEAVI